MASNKSETRQGAQERLVPGVGFRTVREAAAYLHLSRATIYGLMDSGELKYAKFGGARRIPWTALIEYAERCMVRA